MTRKTQTRYLVSYRAGYLSEWRETFGFRTEDQAQAIFDDTKKMGFEVRLVRRQSLGLATIDTVLSHETYESPFQSSRS
jgi:hypothetical protein